MQNSIESILNDYLEKLKHNFWKRVNKTDTCWNWAGAILVNAGYGSLGRIFDRKTYSAHRLSWMLHNGAIPDGYQILHKCDNRLCIKPDHLFLGNASDNIRDMFNKFRQARGEVQWKAKLTSYAVKDIRQNYRKRKIQASIFAIKYGVSTATIRDVLYRKTWKHIP